MYINLYQQGKTLWDMDSLQHVQVKQIAGMCPEPLAGTNARAVLRLVYDESVTACPGAKMANQGDQALPQETGINPDAMYLGNNIPNPFNNITVIPYFVPEQKIGELVITSITGQETARYKLYSNAYMFELDMSSYENGIYLYTMYIDSRPVQTKRMVLVK